jgi:LDH2 family malate/lactate/ureidoglycolate dehydrogenase
MPGEIEWERRQKALVDGIILPEDVRISVAELARELGLESPFERPTVLPHRLE